jgi:F-type H+-transporting ATPase subunit b
VQLDWSTLLLEVVNFLILVWILKRFLYKPVLDVIARRKAAIDKTLSDAEAEKAEAKQLQEKFQTRLADWEREKKGLRNDLDDELRAQRERLTAELQRALSQEREKQTVLAQRQIADLQAQACADGMQQGLQFTAKLLGRVAGPELESKLVSVALQDLPLLSDAQKQALRTACHDPRQTIRVASAFPLIAPQRAAVTEAIASVSGQPVNLVFHEDAALLAGVRINVGPWTLRANLQDDLAFFGERARDGG